MATAFPRINEFPSYGMQQDQLRRAGWGGLPSMSSYVGPRSASPRTSPAQMYGAQAGAGRGYVNPVPVAATRGYTPLTAQPPTQATPMNPYSMEALVVPQVPAAYSSIPSFAGVPNSYDAYDFQGASPAAGGSMWDSLGALFKQGKDAYSNNKDWLFGDSKSIGAIPALSGILGAINQYGAGKAGIESQKRQNELAENTFNFNRTGILAEVEEQTGKRARQEFLTKNPNASTAQVYSAAEPVIKERMKRFA